jgi:syntaxin-binding protein 1
MLISREKATSLNDMRDMLASLPQFQEMRDQFSLHLNVAEKCMEMFEQQKLLEVGLIEQVLRILNEIDFRTALPEPLQKERYPKLYWRKWSRFSPTQLSGIIYLKPISPQSN